MKITVCGAGGYIGSRLVAYLEQQGHEHITAVTSRPNTDPFRSTNVHWTFGDLRSAAYCDEVVKGSEWVFNLAASVGGIGFVTTGGVKCLSNVVINTHLLDSSFKAHVSQYFFASSSCVYPSLDCPLREDMLWSGPPMGGYGLEKLFSEQLTKAYNDEKLLPTCIGRYHGIYGPGDVRASGRDHVATALAKKVIHAKRSGVHEIAIWGDGEQTRSFLYVDDAVEATARIMHRGVGGPVNIAHPEPVSVNQLVSALEEIACVKLTRFYQKNAPVGRTHKTSDNTLLRKSLNWEPETALIDGMRKLYNELWETT
jgi:nucleoside-diphosphate-sugar epimerase